MQTQILESRALQTLSIKKSSIQRHKS